TNTGKEVHPPTGHQAPVCCVAFAPDGRTLISGGEDQTARTWDLAAGKEVGRLGEGGFASCVAVSADGRTVATGGPANLVRVYDRATGKEQSRFEAREELLRWLALSPYGKLIAVPGSMTEVELREAATGREVVPLLNLTGEVDAVAFSPDGQRLAV